MSLGSNKSRSSFAKILGEPVPDPDARGASPRGVGGRVLACIPHFVVAGAIALVALFAPFAEDAGQRLRAGIVLLVLALLALAACRVLAGGAGDAAKYHVAQAMRWLLLSGLALVLAGAAASPFPFILGYLLFLVVAVLGAAPSVVGGYRVGIGAGHRYLIESESRGS